VEERVQQALDKTQPGGQWAIVRKDAMDRFRSHQNVATSGLGRVFQGITGAFRGTVLPFSTRWLFGNGAEATLRSALSGVHPGRDYSLGQRFVEEIRKQHGDAGHQEFMAQVAGGRLYKSTGINSDVFRNASQVADVPIAGQVARLLGAGARAPIAREAVTLLKGYQHGVFTMNTWMESAFEYGVIGKTVRGEIQEMTGSWGKSLRAQQSVLEELAKGALDPKTLDHFATTLNDTLGKYRAFGPGTRRAIQTVMPFVPWYLNAYKFVFYTLPVHHPIKTALAANVEATLDKQFDEDRKQLGDFSKGDLGGAIKLKDGGFLTLARYTPFGAMTALPEQGPIGAATEVLLPQYSSAVWAGAGHQNFAHRPLRGPDGDIENGWTASAIAANAFMESLVPGVSIARRLREGGRTAYDTSTVFRTRTKPGTSYGRSALSRVFNPFNPTYLNAPTTSSGVNTRRREPRRRREPQRRRGEPWR
jgi:hypothetical protein